MLAIFWGIVVARTIAVVLINEASYVIVDPLEHRRCRDYNDFPWLVGTTIMNIVVLDGYTLNPGDNPWTALEALGEVTVFDRTPPADVTVRGKDANVLVVNKVRISKEHLQRLPNLQYITVTATGHDCVDSVAAKKKAVPVSNVPVYGTNSVAQFVFATLLELCHRVITHDNAVRDGEWKERGDFSFSLTPQVELAGKTMGIVGFGRIGRRVGELANAFGMRVLAHSRTEENPPDYEGFEFLPLEKLARESDVISLNCPLTHQTNGFINAGLLSKCKPSAFLINASRGALINESDLASALTKEKLAGAALDVVSTEPIGADNPLLAAPNCIITPHMAWASLEARQRLLQTTVENVQAFIAGNPQHVVNL